MEKVFIYWDNSNIFLGAKNAAASREKGLNDRFRVRINFENMLRLAHADRPIEKAIAAGSVSPEMRPLWNRMERKGVDVQLFDRGAMQRGEQEVPDRFLQLQMLRDANDYNGDPGIAVLLTGDGKGFYDGIGFHSDVERMHRKGWRIEILSWADSCNARMREWAEQNGVFVALDDFYNSVTYLAPSNADYPGADPRPSIPLDLTPRPVAT